MSDVLRKRFGVDLSDVKQVKCFMPDGVLEIIRGAKAVYTLQRFSGFYNSQEGCWSLGHLPRESDIIVPHSLDIPPHYIESIVVKQGNRFAKFHSLAEMSFYFHVRLIERIYTSFELDVYIKPGIVVQNYSIVFRCYYLASELRHSVLLSDNVEPIEVPVGRNVFLKRGEYFEKRMAKL